jgi:CRP-like cAMP-binding protein
VIDIPARIAFLKKIHLFFGLEDDEYEAIAEKLEELPVVNGGVVFEQESKSESFYMIFRGSVRIVRKADGKEIVLATLVKNDYFGEMGLIARRKRSGTVTATSDTTLLFLKRADFEELFNRSHQLRSNMDVAIRSRKLARSLRFKWLRPDEVIYFLARKHAIVLYQKMVLPVLAVAVPIGLFSAWLTITPVFIVLLASILSLVAAIFWIIWTVVDWGNDYYIVTNQRVVWLEKVVGIYDSRQETPIGTILSVGIETDQLGRMLDYGNVIIRTFVGKIPFNHVTHPEQAKHMIEEYWNRTKEHAVGVEKEALKNAVRKRLGLPLQNAGRGFGEPAPVPQKTTPPPKVSAGWQTVLRFLGANTLKLRYESGETVIYRKHWIVLILDAWVSFLSSLGLLVLFVIRLFQLMFDPNASLFSFQNGFQPDTWATIFFIAFFPLVAWFVYQVMDWSNDLK